MNNKVPFNKRQKTNARWDMGDFHVISAADALCGSHACQQNLQLFFSQEVCTLSKIHFTSITWQVWDL